MVVKNDNGKVKIELTEDELIIKRFLKNKRIKRKDIRSACITDKCFMVLSYDYKITYAGISNINSSNKEQLKLLVDEINKEDIIFKNSYIQADNPWLIICILIMWMAIFQEMTLKNIIGGLVYLLIVGLILWSSVRFKGVVYNLNTKTFTRVGYKDFNKGTYLIEDIELQKKMESGVRYKVKENGYKFCLQYESDKINYPLRHAEAAKEIENHFIKTQVIN